MMKKFFLTVICALTAFSFGLAQDTYKWEQYQLSFTVPENMEVLENTQETFRAENENIGIGLVPYEYNEFSEEDAMNVFKTMAENLQLDLSNSKSRKFKGTNCEGIFVVAISKQDSSRLGIIALATSSVSKVCVAVMMLLTEEQAENAGRILGSLTFE
ncbi:MAG: hypothetical protein II937_00090 [Bacteroidales bacterium]|nr:hypothetical protein [Bacteroidales bacterium]